MFYVVGSVHGTGSIIVWNLSLFSLAWDTYCKDLWADSYVNFFVIQTMVSKNTMYVLYSFSLQECSIQSIEQVRSLKKGQIFKETKTWQNQKTEMQVRKT